MDGYTIEKGTKINVDIDPYITSDKTFLPTDIYLEVTSFCNATCYMCPHKTLKREKGIMSWNLVTKIIDDCITLEGKGITFHLQYMGEPLLDPLRSEKIKYIKSKCKKSKVVFNTNGSLLTKEKSEQILKAGIDCIIISLDSLDPKTYLEMRGLELEPVIKNIDDLLEVRNRLKSNIKITMQMVICDKNKHEEKQFKEMWVNKQVRIVIKHMHSFLTEGTSSITDKLSKEQLFPCMQPFMHLMVYWNGDLGVCCWDADHSVDLGNIQDTPLLEAFNSEPYKKIRKAMLVKDCKDIIPCNTCSQIYGHDMNVCIFDKRVRIKKQTMQKTNIRTRDATL
jgi:MoaA/NifB/PqqE/SkfB family radical SAM enzyme